MATLVIPGCVQIAIQMEASGQPVYNVIHLNIGEGIDTPTTTLTDVKTAWEASAGPLKTRSDQVKMIGYNYTDLRSAVGMVQTQSSSTTGIGTAQFSTLSASALIKLQSGTRARSKNGRIYHGPLVEGDINADGRTIDSTKLTALGTAYNNFRTAMNVGERKWVVASRKTLTTAPIANISVASVVATQRRRLR